MSTKDPAGSRESAGGETTPRVIIHKRHCAACGAPIPPSWSYEGEICLDCEWGPCEEVREEVAQTTEALRVLPEYVAGYSTNTLRYYARKWGRDHDHLEDIASRLSYVERYGLEDPDDGTPISSR